MSGDLLLVLLLAMGVGQADKKPGSEHAAVAAEAQVKTEAVRGQKEDAQAKTKGSQKGAAAAQAQTKKAQAGIEVAQAKTKTAQEEPIETGAETKKVQGGTETAQVNTEAGPGQSEEEPAQTDKDPKLTSVPGGNALGMSILGNQEAPTSLVIVPWKSSEVGRSPGISLMLDDSRQPVDKEVFMRALRYYEIRSEKKP
jgi:hypothetical protein